MVNGTSELFDLSFEENLLKKKFIEYRTVVLKIKANKHVLINCEIALHNYFMVNDCGMIVFAWYTNIYVDRRSHIYIFVRKY